jgi:hypothetical protein
MSRSRDTEGSSASILATLDWLDFTSLARSPWVSGVSLHSAKSFNASDITTYISPCTS